MTSLKEIIVIVGNNSSDDNQITIKQICEFLIIANREENCQERVWNLIIRYPHLFNRTRPGISGNFGRAPSKWSLSKNGKHYYAKLIGMNHPFASEVIE